MNLEHILKTINSINLFQQYTSREKKSFLRTLKREYKKGSNEIVSIEKYANSTSNKWIRKNLNLIIDEYNNDQSINIIERLHSIKLLTKLEYLLLTTSNKKNLTIDKLLNDNDLNAKFKSTLIKFFVFIYMLILLITSSLSFALPLSNQQTYEMKKSIITSKSALEKAKPIIEANPELYDPIFYISVVLPPLLFIIIFLILNYTYQFKYIYKLFSIISLKDSVFLFDLMLNFKENTSLTRSAIAQTLSQYFHEPKYILTLQYLKELDENGEDTSIAFEIVNYDKEVVSELKLSQEHNFWEGIENAIETAKEKIEEKIEVIQYYNKIIYFIGGAVAILIAGSFLADMIKTIGYAFSNMKYGF